MGKRLLSILALLTLLLQADGYLAEAAQSVPADFKSIQAAIDNAGAGDTVTVEAGLYKENLVIDKPLTLKSNGSATVEATDRSLPSVKVVGTAGVTIEGFTMTGSAASGLELLNSEGAVISNNIISGNFNGIFVSNSTGSVISGNTIEEEYPVRGIPSRTRTPTRLEDNTVRLNADKGIYITFSDENVITCCKPLIPEQVGRTSAMDLQQEHH